LAGKSALTVLLCLFLPTAHQVIGEAKVSRYLGHAQPAFGHQANRFTLKLGRVLFTFAVFALNSHDHLLWSVSLFHLSTLSGEFQLDNLPDIPVISQAEAQAHRSQFSALESQRKKPKKI
jgi:hypothetical protein